MAPSGGHPATLIPTYQRLDVATGTDQRRIQVEVTGQLRHPRRDQGDASAEVTATTSPPWVDHQRRKVPCFCDGGDYPLGYHTLVVPAVEAPHPLQIPDPLRRPLRNGHHP